VLQVFHGRSGTTESGGFLWLLLIPGRRAVETHTRENGRLGGDWIGGARDVKDQNAQT
jgi:hypothetical protein